MLAGPFDTINALAGGPRRAVGDGPTIPRWPARLSKPARARDHPDRLSDARHDDRGPALPKPSWLAEPEEAVGGVGGVPPRVARPGPARCRAGRAPRAGDGGPSTSSPMASSRGSTSCTASLERLEGIDFRQSAWTIGHSAPTGTRPRLPTVTGPIARKAPVHLAEVRWGARQHPAAAEVHDPGGR